MRPMSITTDFFITDPTSVAQWATQKVINLVILQSLVIKTYINDRMRTSM